MATQSSPTPRPRPPTVVTTMYDLDDTTAHATVRPATGEPGHFRAAITAGDNAVVFVGKPHALRVLFTDLVAQLDAIEAG